MSFIGASGDFDVVLHAQRLRAILRSPQLPDFVNLDQGDRRILGTESCGIIFVKMTAVELRQLARQLHAHPNVTHLNLRGCEI